MPLPYAWVLSLRPFIRLSLSLVLSLLVISRLILSLINSTRSFPLRTSSRSSQGKPVMMSRQWSRSLRLPCDDRRFTEHTPSPSKRLCVAGHHRGHYETIIVTKRRRLCTNVSLVCSCALEPPCYSSLMMSTGELRKCKPERLHCWQCRGWRVVAAHWREGRGGVVVGRKERVCSRMWGEWVRNSAKVNV